MPADRICDFTVKIIAVERPAKKKLQMPADRICKYTVKIIAVERPAKTNLKR